MICATSLVSLPKFFEYQINPRSYALGFPNELGFTFSASFYHNYHTEIISLQYRFVLPSQLKQGEMFAYTACLLSDHLLNSIFLLLTLAVDIKLWLSVKRNVKKIEV